MTLWSPHKNPFLDVQHHRIRIISILIIESFWDLGLNTNYSDKSNYGHDVTAPVFSWCLRHMISCLRHVDHDVRCDDDDDAPRVFVMKSAVWVSVWCAARTHPHQYVHPRHFACLSVCPLCCFSGFNAWTGLLIISTMIVDFGSNSTTQTSKHHLSLSNRYVLRTQSPAYRHTEQRLSH